MKDKLSEMKKVRDEVLNLNDSPLYEYRVKNKNFPVIGEGSHDAEIMLIGEAPGKNEAATGKPFCGASGKILDELLDSIDTKRNNVYITNIVKDRPPENRDPRPEEIALYAPFLDRQIEIIEPKVIATLGRFSMEYIMKRYGLSDVIEPISKAHGKKFETEMPYSEIFVVPLYHPAVAVYNANMKSDLKKDFAVLKELVK